MKLNLVEFKEKLNDLYNHLIRYKETNEIYKCFVFNENKILIINDEYCYEIPFEINIKAIVPANEMIKIVNGIESENIVLKIKENTLILRTKEVQAKIMCLDWDDDITSSIYIESEWKKATNDFNIGIKLNLFSVAKQYSNNVFNCIHITNNRIESTDNYRVSVFEMENKMDDFLLSLDSAIKISKFKTIKYVIGKNWIHFKNKNGTMFHSKIITGKFPNISNLFNIKGDYFDLPIELQKAIKLVSVLSEGDYELEKKIQIKIENGVLKCKAENKTGWIESKIKLNTNKKLLFIINPFFMLEILKLSTKVMFDKEKLLFNNNNFKHIISLYGEE